MNAISFNFHFQNAWQSTRLNGLSFYTRGGLPLSTIARRKAYWREHILLACTRPNLNSCPTHPNPLCECFTRTLFPMHHGTLDSQSIARASCYQRLPPLTVLQYPPSTPSHQSPPHLTISINSAQGQTTSPTRLQTTLQAHAPQQTHNPLLIYSSIVRWPW